MLKKAIISIGKDHFVMPIKSYNHRLSDHYATITLADDGKMEVGTDNLILVTEDSALTEAILNCNYEMFLEPDYDSNGKVKMKKYGTVHE